MRDVVVTSPATITKPVLVSVSHATRDALVVLDERVEDRVRDLIAQLVGVAFGDGLGREQVLGHRRLLDFRRRFEAAEVSQRVRRESMAERIASLNFSASSADERQGCGGDWHQQLASPSGSGATFCSTGSARAGWPRCSARSCPARRDSGRRSSSSASWRSDRAPPISSTCSCRRRASARCSATRTSCRCSTSATSAATTSWRWSTCAAATCRR